MEVYMKYQRLSILLAVANALLLLFLSSQYLPKAQTDTGVLRGRVLELVDDQGQIRAQINLESDGQVVLRLRDEAGNIRVKLGADENGSGLILMDEETEAALQMIARQTSTQERPLTTSITLRTKTQERTITPSQP
jgi:DNA/RNA endonuclease YhcR with UshA esterase domain